jgi:hypothetical protein
MPHSQPAAEDLLNPHIDKWAEIYPRAWKSWERFGESIPDLRMQICPRTRATMLNNFAVHAAEELFADMGPEIVLTDQPGFLLIVVNSELHVRLKKYRGRSNSTSGIPTEQRKMFETQQPILGFPEASNCVHGYMLKPDASGFVASAITCKTGKELHWRIDVPLGSQGQGGIVVERPAPSAPTPEPGISSTILDPERAKEGGIGG